MKLDSSNLGPPLLLFLEGLNVRGGPTFERGSNINEQEPKIHVIDYALGKNVFCKGNTKGLHHRSEVPQTGVVRKEKAQVLYQPKYCFDCC